MIEIFYDSYSLQTNGVTVQELGAYSSPPRDLQIENIAGADGGVLVESRYRPASIPVKGSLTADTQQELEELIQSFKTALNKSEKELLITDEGSYVSYTATPGTITITRPRGLTKAMFDFEFMCANPFGVVDTDITMLDENITTASSTKSVVVQGSYKAEPMMTITINSFTGSGDQSITIRNGRTYAGITITETFTAGDIIEVDCNPKVLTVKLNGSNIEFSGLFPSWEAGNGVVVYNDTFTTRDVDLEITYKKRKI